MDKGEYTTLVEALSEVPDPRHKRGIRHRWCLLMTLIGAAMISGNQHGRAIAQWVREHTEMLTERLEPENGQLPSESTLRRALAAVAVDALEDRLSQLSRPQSKDKSAPIGQSIDGKQVRGCGAHGRKVYLMSLALHNDAQVLAQLAIPDKSGEITAAPKLIQGRDLSGTLTTVDAQLAQREFARQILQQKGHYLMVIKDNQPQTRGAIEE